MVSFCRDASDGLPVDNFFHRESSPSMLVKHHGEGLQGPVLSEGLAIPDAPLEKKIGQDVAQSQRMRVMLRPCGKVNSHLSPMIMAMR
jgi:hypothetical protein